MNHHQQHPQPVVPHPAYCQAFQRLDESLARMSVDSNFERIQLARLVLFGELPDEPEQSGEIKLPE